MTWREVVFWVACTAALLLLLICSTGCQRTSIDPITGRFKVQTVLMEHKTVCRGGTCSSCARGRRAAGLGLVVPIIVRPEIAVPALILDGATQAITDDGDKWCEGFGEILKLPPHKPLEVAPVKVFNWVDYRCIGLNELDPEFEPIISTQWCPPGMDP